MYTPTSFFLLSSWWCLLLLLSSWWCLLLLLSSWWCLLLLLSSWWCLLLPLLRRWWSLLLRCEEWEWWVVEETALSDWRPLASYLCKIEWGRQVFDLTTTRHIDMHLTASMFAWVYKVCAGYMIHTAYIDIMQVMTVVRWMLYFSLLRFQMRCIQGCPLKLTSPICSCWWRPNVLLLHCFHCIQFFSFPLHCAWD